MRHCDDTNACRPLPAHNRFQAYAIDQSAITITSYGASAIEAALQATDLSTLGDPHPDGTYGPWIMSYHAADEAGNESEQLLRLVYIDVSCLSREDWCTETASCSSLLLCMPISLFGSAYVAQVVPYTPPVDTDAPTLVLLQHPGDAIISPDIPGRHILESWVTVGELYWCRVGGS